MKKVLATMCAIVLVLSLTVSAFAYEANEVVLVFYSMSTWTGTVSDAQALTGDGEYTFTIDGLDEAVSMVGSIYIKDAIAVETNDAESGGDFPADIEVTVVSIKVNGEAVEVSDGYLTTFNENGVLDLCYYNEWDVDYFSMDDVIDINSIEITVNVTGFGEAATTEESSDDEAEAAEETSETTEAAETTEETTETTTASSPDTGVALAVVPMIVAMAGAVISKKRK